MYLSDEKQILIEKCRQNPDLKTEIMRFLTSTDLECAPASRQMLSDKA